MFIGLACSFLLTFHIDTSWYRNNCASFGANSTISNLSSLTTADSNDLFPIVDTSAGQTKQITFSNATGSMATFLNATYGIKAGSSNIVTVGTITSGTWNGTALTVPYGGTSSTTLSSNRLFVGNGTGNLISIGQGTSGQYLVSNGAGLAPSFQTASVDQAGTYVWTGPNSWTASTTHSATTSISASNVNSNAFILNGIAYRMPPTRGASGTVMMEDGSGNLTMQNPVAFNIGRTSTSSSGGGTLTIAHGLGVTPKLVRFSFTVSADGAGTNVQSTNYGTGVATSTASTQSVEALCTTDQTGGSPETQSTTLSSAGFVIYSRHDTTNGCDTDNWKGTVTTLDSTNIILTMTGVASVGNGINITWEAYR